MAKVTTTQATLIELGDDRTGAGRAALRRVYENIMLSAMNDYNTKIDAAHDAYDRLENPARAHLDAAIELGWKVYKASRVSSAEKDYNDTRLAAIAAYDAIQEPAWAACRAADRAASKEYQAIARQALNEYQRAMGEIGA